MTGKSFIRTTLGLVFCYNIVVMKKLVAIILLLAAGVAVWNFWQVQHQEIKVEGQQQASAASAEQKLQEKIFTPPPLKSSRQSQDAFLTLHGVIEQTNAQRKINGNLPALAENSKLNQAAMAKLKDMFAKQYFEHSSPTGQGPGDLAKAAGYEYIAVGENLALGNFDSNKVLVQDWMDSPGHRANILNSQFSEIGVAVGEGLFDGKKIWLAVQEFGRPVSSCPKVDANLKAQINSQESEVSAQEANLKELKSQMDAESPKTPEETAVYNQKVADYNNQVKIYNNQVDSLKFITAEYNGQVKAYNYCLEHP